VFAKFSNGDFRMAFESKICSDGAKVNGIYCGVGECNWFGRKCDGGCKESGQTAPPENCDDIFNKRDEILKRYEYCTSQVENESSPYGLETHGGLIKSNSYKNEYIPQEIDMRMYDTIVALIQLHSSHWRYFLIDNLLIML